MLSYTLFNQSAAYLKLLAVLTYMYTLYIAYLLNFDDLDRLLEHQYESTPARYFYRACWFLSIPSLGYQCPFLTYQHSSIVGDLC